MSDWNPSLATPRMLNGARVNLMPRCVYQGSMKITAIEKRKSRPIKRDYDHILKTLLTNYLQAYNISRRCMWHLLMIKAYRML